MYKPKTCYKVTYRSPRDLLMAGTHNHHVRTKDEARAWIKEYWSKRGLLGLFKTKEFWSRKGYLVITSSCEGYSHDDETTRPGATTYLVVHVLGGSPFEPLLDGQPVEYVLDPDKI